MKNNQKNNLDLIINDYKKDTQKYNNLLFHKNTVSHEFFEGIYLKFSKSLTKYLKSHTKTFLIGNKKYENLPLELFLQESEKYQQEMIKEINSNKKIIKDKMFEKNYLTPLPDTPRILLKTEKQKSEFKKAERTAVVLRAFEYNNNFRNKKKEIYCRMNNNQKEQIIYFYNRAAQKIQNFWRKNVKKLREKKIKKMKFLKNSNFLINLSENLIKNKKKKLFDFMCEKIVKFGNFKEKIKLQKKIEKQKKILNDFIKKLKIKNDKKVFDKMKFNYKIQILKNVFEKFSEKKRMKKFLMKWKNFNIKLKKIEEKKKKEEIERKKKEEIERKRK